MFLFQSIVSDDFDYDLYGTASEHNYFKRENDDSTISKARTSENNTSTNCNGTTKFPTPQNNELSASEMSSVSQVDSHHVNSSQIDSSQVVSSQTVSSQAVSSEADLSQKVHTISNRDPRCRKRVNESENPNSNHDDVKSGSHVNDEKVDDNETLAEDDDNEILAEDEDVLDLFGEDDFDEQVEIGDPQPKRARIEINHRETSNVVPLQQPKPSKPTSENIERHSQQAISRPYTIPRKTATLTTTNKTQVTIENGHVSVTRQNGTPQLPSTSMENTKINDRLPIKQRLGVLQGTNPIHFAKNIRKSIPNNIAAVQPKPPTSSLNEASRKRIIQTSQKLRKEPTEIVLTVPPGKTEKPNNCKEYLMPSFVANPVEHQPAFNVPFRNICRKYINDKCSLTPATCPFPHNLPNEDYMRAQLDAMGTKKAVEVYQLFVVRSQKLFNRYAPVFCEYFGAHKLERQLMQTIPHCCRVERRVFSYFTNIVDGFLKMGMSFDMALRKLIVTIPKRTSQANNMILRLILDERNTKLELFFGVLETLNKQAGYVYPIESVNRILRIFVSNTKHSDALMMIIWSILTKIPSSQQIRIDNELLTQFYAKTSSNMGGSLPAASFQ